MFCHQSPRLAAHVSALRAAEPIVSSKGSFSAKSYGSVRNLTSITIARLRDTFRLSARQDSIHPDSDSGPFGLLVSRADMYLANQSVLTLFRTKRNGSFPQRSTRFRRSCRR